MKRPVGHSTTPHRRYLDDDEESPEAYHGLLGKPVDVPKAWDREPKHASAGPGLGP